MVVEDKRSAQGCADRSALRFHDLVIAAAIGEVGFLSLCPATKLVLNGKQLHCRKGAGEFLRNFSITRTVVVLCSDSLAFWRVEVFQISVGDFTRPLSSTTLSTTDTVGSARIDSLG